MAGLLRKWPVAKLEAIFRTVSVEATWKTISNDAECGCSEPRSSPAKSPLSCTRRWASCWPTASITRSTISPAMRTWQAAGRAALNRVSSSIRDSCFQEMVRCYLKAYNAAQSGDPYCCPKAKFCASNPLMLLRWMEDKFGIPWKNVGAIDWQSIPSMDCMVACILE